MIDNKYAAGLSFCAWVWLILLGLGSLIGGIYMWRYDGALIGIAIIAGGVLFAATGFYLLRCIASITDDVEAIRNAPINTASSDSASDSVSWLSAAASGGSIGSSSGRSLQQASPKQGTWKCPACGRVNANYVGTCGCGQKKP